MTLLWITAAWVLAGIVFAAAAYRAIFCFAYLLLPRSRGPAAEPDRLRRFAVLIPAHDEELLIAEVLRTIRAADYPQEQIDVHVIADNCTDATAERVRALGEQAHERSDPENPGKGQAIDWMLQHLDLSSVDAVALFDADNLVDSGFFRAMNRELMDGARCLQGYYGIANPGDTVMTRLLAITYVMKNLLFYAGKARLGLSVILMGTGMVFRREVLEGSGWQAMSIGEDLEQTFHLLESGEKIRFVPDALARAQEATSLRQGYTQRQRWATGRRALAGRARAAIARGIRQRSLEQLDAGVELLMPTYSKLLNWTVIALGVALVATHWTWLPAILVALACLYQVFETGVALRIMRAEPRFIRSLVFAPVFLAWKAAIDLLAVVGHRRDAWTRTARQPHTELETPAREASPPAPAPDE